MAAKKTIENKPTELTTIKNGVLVKLSYFDVIKVAFDAIPKGQNGFSRDDINKRNRIEKKLKGKSAELEHDEFYFIKKTCNEIQWPTRHEDMESFLNYLDDVK